MELDASGSIANAGILTTAPVKPDVGNPVFTLFQLAPPSMLL
jgi:hypothetical protein